MKDAELFNKDSSNIPVRLFRYPAPISAINSSLLSENSDNKDYPNYIVIQNFGINLLFYSVLIP